MKANTQAPVSFNWDNYNWSRIDKLIAKYGRSNHQYDKTKPPYIVLDWDNTCISGDIGEAVFMYQLKNLQFACTPIELKRLLFSEFVTNAALNSWNTKGKYLDISKVAIDIFISYVLISNNTDISYKTHHHNFFVKMLFLYDAIYKTFGPEVAYQWSASFLSGFTTDEIDDLTSKATEWQLLQPIAKEWLTSPAENEISFQFSGQVKVLAKYGIRLIPEMQLLCKQFIEAGFDIWICSASYGDIVKHIATSPKYNYNIHPKHILALEFEHTTDGKISHHLLEGTYNTYGIGKTQTIRKFLSGENGKYGYDPILVAGDSIGDQNMLNDFEEMKLGLIINRSQNYGDIMSNLYSQATNGYGKKDTKYLLQGINDNTGEFVPSQHHIHIE